MTLTRKRVRWFWPALLLSGAGYVLLALWFPLLPNLARVPAVDIRTFTGIMAGGLAYGGILVLLSLLLIQLFRSMWQYGLPVETGRRPGWRGPAFVLGVAALFGLPLVLAYPVNASDIFRYALRGRITSIYGGNPFTALPTEYANDFFLPLAGEWAAETTPYGPVWEIVAAVAARVLPASMGGTLLLFKLAGLLALLGGAAVLWLLLSAKPDAQRAAYVALWAWNPALLLTFVANAHNDGLMLLWLLLAMLALQRRRPALGLLLVVVAILTKPIAALALPVLLVAALRRAGNGRERWRTVAALMLGGVALAAVAFLPWAARGGWAAAPTALFERLVRESAAGAGFSPATFVYFAAQAAGLTLSLRSISVVLTVLFGVFYVALLWRAWRGESSARLVAGAFYGYLLQALNFRIWYAAWPFPFLIQDAAEKPATGAPTTYLLRAGFWFLLTTQLSVILYGHVRVALLGGSHMAAHLIGVPLTFLLPWVLAHWRWLAAGESSASQGVGAPSAGHSA